MHPSLELLRRLEPLGGLSDVRLQELASLCVTHTALLGQDALSQLETQHRLVYLVAGELKLALPDGGMQLLVGACDAGCWPIGYKAGWPVASKAITDVVLLSIDTDLIDIMMTWEQLSVAADSPPVPQATEWSSLGGVFNARVLTSSALSRLPPAHIHELLQRFQRQTVKAGERVVNEGDEGDFYYLIESGRCAVVKRVGGVDMEVAELRAGEAFGEESLVSQAPRGASVTMKTDGVLLRLAKPDFIELLREPLLQPIERAEAEARVAGGSAIWLDVRYPAEFAENALPEAINVPLNEIRAAFAVLDRQREYIVYCQSGRRSSAAAFLLAQNGFKARWLRAGLGEREAS